MSQLLTVDSVQQLYFHSPRRSPLSQFPAPVEVVPRIDTADETQRWRYKCPECGSEYWRCNDGSFRCRSCKTNLDRLADAVSGETVPREDFEFIGPHANHKAAYRAEVDE